MSGSFFLDTLEEDEESIDIEMVECSVCEARYSIILGEDFLNEEISYCPFCGEYIVRE